MGRVPLARFLARRRSRVVVAIAATVAVGSAVALAAVVGPRFANADPEPKAGLPVPPELLTHVVAAARSCPTLSPARLAGQLMANSQMNAQARLRPGQEGIAGLGQDAWKAWAPWPDAARTDQGANIAALAHHMCDLVGQLRAAKVGGDPWRTSLAAFRVGAAAVRAAGGVPAGTASYVDEVGAYAAWYGEQPEFGGDGRPSTDLDARPVPDEYVAPVKAAGGVCPQVPAPLVAAHLMVASGFNPDRLGGDGARGIAQFKPEVWAAYAPKDASVWDPKVAIPVLGTALCALTAELNGVSGDPVKLAVAAFEIGTDAARQVTGKEGRATGDRSEKVSALVGYYARDTRLAGGAPPSPAPSASASPSAKPSPTPSASPTRSPTPAGPPTVRLLNRATNKCMTGTGDGATVLVKPCTGGADQQWDVRTDGTIRTGGLCLEIPANPQDGTNVRTVRCTNAAEQKFRFDQEFIVGLASSKCVDGWHGVDNADPPVVYAWACLAPVHHRWYFG
jgi:hypothetical protein